MKEDMEYPYRKTMLTNLLKNNKLAGLTYVQVKKLLGEPDFKDSLTATYEVYVHYDVIDPDHIIDLDITLSKDSMVTNVNIRDWKKR